MISAIDIQGPLAALAAGAITSLHCVGMCGPLSCGVCLKGGTGGPAALAVYQLTRVLSYACLGGLAGAMGRMVAGDLVYSLTGSIPWFLLVFFVLVAFGWDKRTWLTLRGSRWLAPVLSRASRLGVVPGAALLGAATPFIPCGPLYFVTGAAVVSGSGVAGALLLAAFGAGAVPFYFGMQAGFLRLGGRLPAGGLEKARRGLAMVSVVLVLARIFFPAAIGNAAACVMCR